MIRHDRIARAQALMREQNIAAIVVLNHDDFRWFLGIDRTQPRAIIPQVGPPTIIAFAAEEPELRGSLNGEDVLIFTSVGGQINDVVTYLRRMTAEYGRGDGGPRGEPVDGPVVPGRTDAAARPKVAMQQWFETPAFLVDLFRRVNPGLELVSSDSVMDPLRAVKDPDELAHMAAAQRIAGLGMDRVRQLLRPGVTAHELATEALYAMLRAGAEDTSTPVYVNVGLETCMLHGRRSPKPVGVGDLVVVDLTPRVEGYCANLARTFVIGEPDARQRELLDAYAALIPAARDAMRPGATVAELDARVGEVLHDRHLDQLQVNGIGHGIGLRFEETPASTIIPPHRHVPLREGMTITIGHTILAIPGLGGVRHEDVYRVTPSGGVLLAPYPIDPMVRA